METIPVVFGVRKVRRVLYDGEWHLAVVDVLVQDAE